MYRVILGSRDRTRIVDRLLRSDSGRLSVGTLAHALADDGDVDRARLRLYHNHVPKLEAAGVLIADWEAEKVWLTVDPDRIEPVLTALREVEADEYDVRHGPTV